jgi:RNA polymerase sigma factor (sigma-70 family)
MNPKILEAVKSVQNGEKQAFETLYGEFSQLAYFTAVKLLNNNQHEAEDAVQEAFIKVYQKIGELKDPQAFPAWFKRIVVNHCTDVLIASKPTISTEEVEELDFIEETDDSLIPDKSLDNAETARLIMEIIDKLPEPQRVCILCYYYEQLSVSEIAESLAVSENTIKTRLSLGREKIRKALEELEDKEGIKLYGIAPFIVPALNQAMTETEVPEHLFSNISSSLELLSGATNTGLFGTISELATGTKALLAAGCTVLVGGIITIVVLIANGGGVAEEALANITDTTAALTSNTTANATTTATTTESETAQTTTDEPTETTTEDSATSDDSTGDTDTESPATTQTAEGNTPAPEQPQNPTNPTTTQAPQTTRPTTPTTPSAPSLTVGELVRYGSVDFRVLEVRSDSALIITERSIGQHYYFE